MPRPKADRSACQGYANCVATAPDIYDLDDDGNVTLLRDVVGEQDRPRIEEAVRGCPVGALDVDYE